MYKSFWKGRGEPFYKKVSPIIKIAMKAAVISDTHRNTKYLKKVLDFLKEENIDYIFHLGDDYKDTELLQEFQGQLIKVPGVFDPEYLQEDIINRRIETIEDLRIMLSHTLKSHKNDRKTDLSPEEVIASSQVDLFLYGHTHIWEIKEEKGIIFINPGHLQEKDTKTSNLASYAIISWQKPRLQCQIIDINKNILLEKEFIL